VRRRKPAGGALSSHPSLAGVIYYLSDYTRPTTLLEALQATIVPGWYGKPTWARTVRQGHGIGLGGRMDWWSWRGVSVDSRFRAGKCVSTHARGRADPRGRRRAGRPGALDSLNKFRRTRPATTRSISHSDSDNQEYIFRSRASPFNPHFIACLALLAWLPNNN
jgi:hypothetical protein